MIRSCQKILTSTFPIDMRNVLKTIERPGHSFKSSLSTSLIQRKFEFVPFSLVNDTLTLTKMFGFSLGSVVQFLTNQLNQWMFKQSFTRLLLHKPGDNRLFLFLFKKHIPLVTFLKLNSSALTQYFETPMKINQ